MQLLRIQTHLVLPQQALIQGTELFPKPNNSFVTPMMPEILEMGSCREGSIMVRAAVSSCCELFCTVLS